MKRDRVADVPVNIHPSTHILLFRNKGYCDCRCYLSQRETVGANPIKATESLRYRSRRVLLIASRR
jgi:hypothetical protein